MLKIDKKFLIALVALIAIAMFLLEPFQWGSGRNGAPALPTGRNVSGTAVFNGTIRTYDPLLLIAANTSQAVVDQARNKDGVEGIRTDPRYPEYLIIDTGTRDDVYPLAAWLRSINVTSMSVANIAVNRDIEVETAGGKVNATIPGGVVRVVAEPLLDTDSEVTVSMLVVLNGQQILDYSSAGLVLQTLDLQLDATVEALDRKAYSYSIPWENRNSLGDLSPYGAVDYKKLDSIIFEPPLDVSQIIVKKQFSYILYIDASSAQVDPSFHNLTQLQANFQDTPFTLPPSKLTITTNLTASEAPDLPFSPSVGYRYAFALQNTSYDFGAGPLLVETDREYDINSTVKLNISVTALGDKIISVKRVSLPS